MKSPGHSHLTGRDDLQRPESGLEVGSVGLEIVESSGNLRLQLGGVLPRRAVGSDLVKGGRHDFGLWCCPETGVSSFAVETLQSDARA